MAEKKRPGQKFKMLSVDEILGVNNEESAIDLKINEIVPFKDHPFRVTDDEKMEELVKSIRMNGILGMKKIRQMKHQKETKRVLRQLQMRKMWISPVKSRKNEAKREELRI